MSNPTHTVEYEIQESWARIGAVAWSYVQIAKEAYAEYLSEESKRLPKPLEGEPGDDYYAQSRQLFHNAVKTVVFCGMSLEAAIFDLAAIQLGDKYALEVIDKLDVLQKWLVVPRLVCGKALSETSPGINALRTVIRARNSLVHAKSLSADSNHSTLQQANKRSTQLDRDVHECFSCVILLSLELNTLLGITAGVLPLFEINYSPTSEESLPIGLRKAIERARQIHARSKKKIYATL